jgi:hypothetical protein
VDSRALLAKMPLFGIGLTGDHGQLLLHRLVLAAARAGTARRQRAKELCGIGPARLRSIAGATESVSEAPLSAAIRR